jgi:hypothetical protein
VAGGPVGEAFVVLAGEHQVPDENRTQASGETSVTGDRFKKITSVRGNKCDRGPILKNRDKKMATLIRITAIYAEKIMTLVFITKNDIFRTYVCT